MALRVAISLSSSVPQPLGKFDSGSKHSATSTLSWKNDKQNILKWAVYGGGDQALSPIVEDKDHSLPSDESRQHHQTNDCAESQEQNLRILQRPLFINDLSPSPSDTDAGFELKSSWHNLQEPDQLSCSPSDTSKLRVAYKGGPGSFSEAATLKAYPLCEAVPCDQFEAALQAVESKLVNKAILPIESSVGGSFHRNYDLLLRHRVYIVGEVQMVVRFCLLGIPGVRKEELKRVLSDSEALSQCKINLSKLDVVKESVNDTASGAQFVVSNNLRDTGAVASARAAEIYGLDILAEKLEDDSNNNITRFLILGREPLIPGTDRPFKTSIVFSLEEGPGVLFKALAVFALRSINLTKIESRPQRNRPLRAADDAENGNAKYFDYLFYIDFEASMADPRAQNALGHLQEFATFLRVLGCYPIDKSL